MRHSRVYFQIPVSLQSSFRTIFPPNEKNCILKLIKIYECIHINKSNLLCKYQSYRGHALQFFWKKVDFFHNVGEADGEFLP